MTCSLPGDNQASSLGESLILSPVNNPQLEQIFNRVVENDAEFPGYSQPAFSNTNNPARTPITKINLPHILLQLISNSLATCNTSELGADLDQENVSDQQQNQQSQDEVQNETQGVQTLDPTATNNTQFYHSPDVAQDETRVQILNLRASSNTQFGQPSHVAQDETQGVQILDLRATSNTQFGQPSHVAQDGTQGVQILDLRATSNTQYGQPSHAAQDGTQGVQILDLRATNFGQPPNVARDETQTVQTLNLGAINNPQIDQSTYLTQNGTGDVQIVALGAISDQHLYQSTDLTQNTTQATQTLDLGAIDIQQLDQSTDQTQNTSQAAQTLDLEAMNIGQLDESMNETRVVQTLDIGTINSQHFEQSLDMTQNETQIVQTLDLGAMNNQQCDQSIDPKQNETQVVQILNLAVLNKQSETSLQYPMQNHTATQDNNHAHQELDQTSANIQILQPSLSSAPCGQDEIQNTDYLNSILNKDQLGKQTTLSQIYKDVNLDLTEATKNPLENALLEAVTQNSELVTPLIKQDLRNKIKSRRKCEGLEDIKVEFKTPKKYKLRPEEIQKMEARKKRNRNSAHVSRERRKTYEKRLEKLVEELEQERDKRMKINESLRQFETKLRARFVDHLNRCNAVKIERLIQSRNETLLG